MNGTTLLLLGAAAYAIYELSQPSAPTVQSSSMPGQFSYQRPAQPARQAYTSPTPHRSSGYIPAGSPGAVTTGDAYMQSLIAQSVVTNTQRASSYPDPTRPSTLPAQVSSGGDSDHPFGPAHDTYVAPPKSQAEIDADNAALALQNAARQTAAAAWWAQGQQCSNIAGEWISSRAGCGTRLPNPNA